MLQTMTERMETPQFTCWCINADELEEGEKLKVEVARRFKCAELYLTEFTPIMGVHAGPGVLAIAFWKEEPQPPVTDGIGLR